MTEIEGASKTNNAYNSTLNTVTFPSSSTQENNSSSSDTVIIGSSSSSSSSSGIYTKSAGVKPDSAIVDELKQEAQAAMDNLRSFVAKLLSNQHDSKSTTLSADDINNAKQAVSEDGEFGVKAVSDRIVDFAKAICGNDKSKLAEIKAAIEKGFDEVKTAFNGTLPDITNQTHDAIMDKLDSWASGSDTSQSE